LVFRLLCGVKICGIAIKMKKIIITLMVTILTANMFAIPASAEWVVNKEKNVSYYLLDDGNYAKNILYRIDNLMYYFNENGVCEGKYTGWTKQKTDETKKRYYVNGEMIVGCHKIGSYYYFFNEKGYLYSQSDKISMEISMPEIEYMEDNIIIHYSVLNISEVELIYGENFVLERKDGESYHKMLELDTWYYHDIAIGLKPNQEDKRIVNVSFQYGTLENGTYRIAYDDCSRKTVSRSEPFEIINN